MSSINKQIIATRLRVAKNFNLLIGAGVDSMVAAEIVSKHNNLAFNDIRVADDRIVIEYKTCTSKHSVDFPIAA
ncbi:hypothetical protein PA10_00049 [Pseudomonas phage pPa_SNUABM_DT01]|nr:hypothetical protein PA10_00049 [Pseudomonas phage pPa_SNUABM_DT01]